MARPEKVSAVKEITAKFEGADATLVTEYRGLRVSEIAEVREALRGANAEYKVMKNTLARIAVREVGLDDLVGELTGPTAVVFVQGDVAAAAKALDEAAKKYPVLIIKGGTLKGGKIFSAEQAKALAKIEPREVLLAKIAMLANSPAQQTANVLSALLRNFGSMLAQVVAKKESGELPGGESAAAPETEAPAESVAADEAPAAEATETPAEVETEAAPEPEAAETEAEEPPVPATEEPDPAQEAADEASAGTADTSEDK
jgi:large subunit ribosomal protein L10